MAFGQMEACQLKQQNKKDYDLRQIKAKTISIVSQRLVSAAFYLPSPDQRQGISSVCKNGKFPRMGTDRICV